MRKFEFFHMPFKTLMESHFYEQNQFVFYGFLNLFSVFLKGITTSTFKYMYVFVGKRFIFWMRSYTIVCRLCTMNTNAQSENQAPNQKPHDYYYHGRRCRLVTLQLRNVSGHRRSTSTGAGFKSGFLRNLVIYSLARDHRTLSPRRLSPRVYLTHFEAYLLCTVEFGVRSEAVVGPREVRNPPWEQPGSTR